MQDTAMDIVLQSIDDLDGEEDLRNAYIKAYESNRSLTLICFFFNFIIVNGRP